MSAHKVRRCRDYVVVLFMFVMLSGWAGCSSVKALKSIGSGGGTAGQQEQEGANPSLSEEGGEGVKTIESIGVTESAEADRLEVAIGDDGDIKEIEIEILSDPDGSMGSGGVMARIAPKDLEFGLGNNQSGPSSRSAGEEQIRIVPFAPDGSSHSSGTVDIIDGDLDVPEGAPGASDFVIGVKKTGSAGEDGATQVPEPLVFASVQPDDVVASSALEPIASPGESFFVREGFENIYFDFDQWAIPKSMYTRLSEHADWLKSHPETEIRIEGHCDVRGSREYNVVLGEKRARSVKSFLVDLGVPETRISLLSFGKERLSCLQSGESCHQENRRAQVVLK